VLRDLPNATLDALKPRLRTQNFAPGQVLFAAGDQINKLYFMRSGAVSLVCELASGQMVESAMIGSDSVVGGGAALDNREAIYKAVVQIGGMGFALDVVTARHIARESEDFRRALFRNEQLILAQAQQSAACNARHSLRERLAKWLLRTRDVVGNDAFTLTQEYMAEMLGVRRTSMSLVAHALRQARLISYRRGQIKINNPEALHREACECYSNIRLRYNANSKPMTTLPPSPGSTVTSHQAK
jgi:CRP-like cAMP-binding protein